MPGFNGPIKTIVDLDGPDSPGAQPFASFNSTTAVQTTNYTASFGEEVWVGGGGFAVTLPLITPASKGSRITVVQRGNPAVGGAAPQNVSLTPNAANSIGGSALAAVTLLSGRSTIVLESDGGTDWVIVQVPSCPSTPATLGATPQTLTRQGPYTRVAAPAVLGGATTYTFSNTGAVPGDIFELSVPSHDANTITVKNAAGTNLVVHPNTVANGSRYLFNSTAWEVLLGGNSTS